MTKFDIDELRLYFGDPYVINDYIKIKNPTIGDIIEYGEAEYFSMVHNLTAIPSDLKATLWDKIGLDWNEVSDWELFMMLAPTMSVETTSVLLGDLDLSKFKPYQSKQNDNIVLADKESGIIIDQMIYLRMVNYLRKLHNIKPKIEKAANKATKKLLLEEDRMKIKMAQDKPYKSYLLPVISAVKVKQGYTKDYVKNMNLSELFDDIARLNIVDQANHLLNGMYSGFADLSSVPKKNFDWMRPIDDN